MTDTRLPTGFAALEPFVAEWAIEGSAARARHRGESAPESRQAFCEAVAPMVMPALELLDQKPLRDLDAAEQRLMNLLLSFTHAAQAVEILGAAEPRHAALRETMRITRSPADLAPAA